MKTGSCECGQVKFELQGELRPVIACHCSQCRKTSGHYWSATSVNTDDLKITESAGLTWYRSSDIAQRGFCASCGASVFWRRDDEDTTSIGAGTFDGNTGLQTAKHICVADKGTYYEIMDQLPQEEQF